MRSLVTGLVAGALALGSGENARADLAPGDMVGNYRVERLVAEYPQGGVYASDLEFHNGELYAMRSLKGHVQKVDLVTGDITDYLWIDGDSLHDDISFDAPHGLVFSEGDGYMASRVPDSIRRFSTTGPTTQQNPTYVSDFFSLSTNSPMDLAFVNGSLYFPTYPDGKIIEFNPLNGQVVRSFDSPRYNTYALTYDGQDLLMVHSLFASDRVFTRMGLDGVIKEQSHFDHGSSIQGLAYDLENNRAFASDTEGSVYSMILVPEPSSLGLLAAGAGAASGRKRRK